VVTGVCLSTLQRSVSFSVVTDVTFKELTEQEKDYYIQRYKPYDKAGAYGIQEWIGCIGVRHINGSFYNVMGLPLHRLYTELEKLMLNAESLLNA
jgi:septum formation protein